MPGHLFEQRKWRVHPHAGADAGPRKGKTAQARLWAYVVDDRASGASGPALAWYRFTPDRSGIHPQTELK